MEIKDMLSSFQGANPDGKALEDSFKQIAEQLICGGFLEARSGEKVNRIFIDDVEFYYHEEKENGLIDPIMYHRNHPEYKKQRTEPYYSVIGELNMHQSGFDITFENEKLQFRASALIRGFRTKIDGKTESRSTYLYGEIFKGMSLFNSITIEWVEQKLESRKMNPEPFTRENVKKYKGYEKTCEKCTRPWRFKLL